MTKVDANVNKDQRLVNYNNITKKDVLGTHKINEARIKLIISYNWNKSRLKLFRQLKTKEQVLYFCSA